MFTPSIYQRFSTVALLCFLTITSTLLFASKVTIEVDKPISQPGRLHIVLSPSDENEPRLYSAWPTKDVEPLFSVDLKSIINGEVISLEQFRGFPHAALKDLPSGVWYLQAVYDTNTLDSGINSPLNYYSSVQKLELTQGKPLAFAFTLNQQVPEDSLPENKDLLKFVKMKSDVLTEFWGSDMYLRAGVLLPATYFDKPLAKFPVFFDIGGYGSRYTRANGWYESESFQEYWQADDTPQMVIVFLDGEAPFGDSYQINSANNGPYGDATWQELLPYLTNNFNIDESAQGRFVSGCSTGGWVSLALQLYYPDTFNGTWSYSADGVDFRYFQLVNVYEDSNAYVNEHGQQRPSYRAKDGEIIFSIQHEINMENTMGRTNRFVTSGGQWGGWNAVYSPQGKDGLPAAIWDPETGAIDSEVAKAWEKYDLRLYTQNNWAELGPKLKGKLHIWMGDMDNFYLNNAMYLYEDMLKERTEPTSDASFSWQRGVGHCDYDREEMRQSTISQMYQRYIETNK